MRYTTTRSSVVAAAAVAASLLVAANAGKEEAAAAAAAALAAAILVITYLLYSNIKRVLNTRRKNTAYYDILFGLLLWVCFMQYSTSTYIGTNKG